MANPRLYVRQGGAEAADTTELTGFLPMKGAPMFEGGDSLLQMGNRCANGEAGQGTFKLIDPDAELPRTDFEYNLPAHTLVTLTEDAPGAEIWLARTRNISYDGGRGIALVDNQVEFDGTVEDCNVELRGQAFTEPWERPQETDVARLIALQAHTLNGWDSTATDFRGTCDVTVRTDHLTPNTNTVSMPAKTYPVGTQPSEVVQDCADTAGKVYGVVIHHTGEGTGPAPEVVSYLHALNDQFHGFSGVTATNQLMLVVYGKNANDGTTTITWKPDQNDSSQDQPLTNIHDWFNQAGFQLSLYALWNPTLPEDLPQLVAIDSGSADRSTTGIIVVSGYAADPTASFTYAANAGVGTSGTCSVTAATNDLVLSGIYVNNESTSVNATGTGQILLDWEGGTQWMGAISEQPGAGGSTTSGYSYTGTSHGNQWQIGQAVLPGSDALGSHLCLFYTVETDHDTYPSPIKISDHLSEWDPEDLTAPVYEPHWESGKATLYNGQMNLSGLVNIYNSAESIFVENPSDVSAYDYWVEPHYDSESTTLTQATLRAGGLLTYRRLTQVTHRVSIIMLPEQTHLVTAGMSIVIKAAAAMGGQYLDTDQTRRVVEHQFEPRIDGRYWAHLSLDRSPHRRVPSKGALSPSAITPHTADELEDVDTSSTPPTDGQALVWDDTAQQWVPGDVTSDHGGLTGLADDDHPQYLLLADLPAELETAGHYEVIVSGTAPPVAVSNEAEDDWLYGFVS